MNSLSGNCANTMARLMLTAQLLFQFGIGLGYYSNMASGSFILLLDHYVPGGTNGGYNAPPVDCVRGCYFCPIPSDVVFFELLFNWPPPGFHWSWIVIWNWSCVHTCNNSIRLLHFLPIATWSIWLDDLPSGDIHVALWGKMLPPMTRSLKTCRLGNSSPLSFMQPNPWCPVRDPLSASVVWADFGHWPRWEF